MPYNPGDENKYFSAVIAALIVIVAAIGYFIWSLLSPAQEFVPAASSVVISEDINGDVHVNPGDGAIPSSAPFVPTPLNAPPSN